MSVLVRGLAADDGRVIIVYGWVSGGCVKVSAFLLRDFLVIEAERRLNQTAGRVSGLGDGVHELVSVPLAPKLFVLALVASFSIPVAGYGVEFAIFGQGAHAVADIGSAIAAVGSVRHTRGATLTVRAAGETPLARVLAGRLLGQAGAHANLILPEGIGVEGRGVSVQAWLFGLELGLFEALLFGELLCLVSVTNLCAWRAGDKVENGRLDGHGEGHGCRVMERRRSGCDWSRRSNATVGRDGEKDDQGRWPDMSAKGGGGWMVGRYGMDEPRILVL